MARIAVTGVAGLLGSHFSRHLLDKGHEVVGIDNLSGGYRDFVDPRVHFFEADLVRSEAVHGVFLYTKPDYVYHFAAYAAVGLSPFIRNFNYTNNIVASANVVNNCINHDVKKVVFTSSMDVYGSHRPPYTEAMRPMPEDPYGIAKYAVEMDLEAANRMFGLKYSIVRPHNVFGVYQNIWDKYRNVIGIWIRQTLSGQPLTVFGDGLQVRAFSDIKYYMEPFEKLMTVGDSETFNLGSDNHVTINELLGRFRLVASCRGYNPTVVRLTQRDEVYAAYSDHTKAANFLGFKDDTDLEDLIDKMFAWAETQPVREVREMTHEVDKKMYEYWKH